MYRHILPIAALSIAGAAAASAQTGGTSSPPVARSEQKAAVDSEPDDIIVNGFRERSKLPTFVQAPAQSSVIENRKQFEYSERIAECAARSKLSDLSRLRAVVDGEFNSATHAVAQDRLKRIYITCSESASLLNFTSGAPRKTMTVNSATGVIEGGNVAVDAAPLGHSIYDRGAFIIEAMQKFAPDLTLTKADTGNQQTQSRFNLREVPRNRFRSPADYRYFEVAVCMVRLQPRLAVRLALGEGRAKLDGIQATLINNARRCVGNARRVDVDPVQFRIYIADAVYRWAVAAKGVDSLIPAA